jgi:hypothetical protein
LTAAPNAEFDVVMEKRRPEHSAACRRSGSSCVCEFSDVFTDAPSQASIRSWVRSIFRRRTDHPLPRLPRFEDVVASPNDSTPLPVDIDLTKTPEEQSQDLSRPLEAG